MTLIACYECKKQVSTDAPYCPGCGAEVKKPLSTSIKLLSFIIAFGIIGTAYNQHRGETAKVAETPEEKLKKTQETQRLILANSFAENLRTNLRDPDSLHITSLRMNDDASIVCADYRAKNGFGGVNREIIVMSKKKKSPDFTVSKKVADWNALCTQNLFDMIWALKK